MKHLWFKRKTYGWGWYPATWQAWLILAGFIAFTIWNFLRLDTHSHSVSDTVRPFLIETLGAGLLLTLIAWLTGEQPRWQWGNDDTKDS